MNWQPIQTAPKDGTMFIGTRYLCARTEFANEEVIVEWMVSDAAWQDGRYRFRDITAGTPTHWMPLEPPE